MYLYEITLLSNASYSIGASLNVLYLYEITLLSNNCGYIYTLDRFCTSTKLHYSQTGMLIEIRRGLFCTSTKLHYSQT